MSEEKKTVEFNDEELEKAAGGQLVGSGGSKYPLDQTSHLNHNDSFQNGNFLFVFPGSSGGYPLGQKVECNQYVDNGRICIGSMKIEVGVLKNEMEYRGTY